MQKNRMMMIISKRKNKVKTIPPPLISKQGVTIHKLKKKLKET